ncbi:MAG: hypothetical protein NTV54_03655 [Ignavibacteriales bacterium]|nr:hypothetical protein [Ignavibacteriales bacterium]
MKSLLISVSTLCLLFLIGCSNLKDNNPSAAPPASSLHDKGWNDTTSSGFHGKFLKAVSYDTRDCQPCHGKILNGGTSDVSCKKCHNSYPHLAGWVDVSSAAFHGTAVAGLQWKMDQCRSCHGPDYTGGTSSKSCLTAGCHQSRTGAAKTPEMCNTCHGDFRGETTDIVSWAPPRTLAGDTVESVRGVGAHRKHLAGSLGRTVRCQECHVVPATLYAQGHLDSNTPAEVYMRDTIANTVTAHGTQVPHPLYTSSTGSCASTYCHGNWTRRRADSPSQGMFTDSVMAGAAFTPKWTGGSVDAACGTTCHTNPPKGHLTVSITSCASCHGEVVDGTGKIIDKTKHINGKINVGGTELKF